MRIAPCPTESGIPKGLAERLLLVTSGRFIQVIHRYVYHLLEQWLVVFPLVR